MTEEPREVRRKKRVIEYAEKIGSVHTACGRFGIARSTFYVWRDRYRESGDDGLKSRRFGCHHNHPNKTPDEGVEKILHLRRTYHRFGSARSKRIAAMSSKRSSTGTWRTWEWSTSTSSRVLLN